MREVLARMKALADPTRLKLVRLLMERECAVHELTEVLATGQSRVSQHLAKLKAAHLVRERRHGREVYYAADPAGLLGMEGSLLTFLHTPLDAVPDVRAEHLRWRRLPAGAPAGEGIPVDFRPAPAATGGGRILFICTANSFRSQMAEAWARHLGAEADSAGLEPQPVHPLARRLMQEAGVDMAGQEAKAVTPQLLAEAAAIVTLCGSMGWFPATGPAVLRQHWPYPDPAALTGPEAEVLAQCRRLRDDIGRRVGSLLAAMGRAS